MIELIQFPWSPFCIVQRRILEFSGISFKVTNIPATDRSLVWKLTRARYYQVPILRDGRQVVFETSDDSQVIAKYLNKKLGLGLFPPHLRGLQTILSLHIENEIEGVGFKLNDVHYRAVIPESERLAFVRHKERKFGRGCLERWREEKAAMLKQLEARLFPYEQMLLGKPFLLGDRPHFVDFDLYGMLGNFLASRKYELPTEHTKMREWYEQMTRTRAADFSN
ncbi:MAG: glutathione S-transferase [Verrucomicrobia bacterium]|nr:glutathione S-transferase [Verrucomicrobiota bacterium]